MPRHLYSTGANIFCLAAAVVTALPGASCMTAATMAGAPFMPHGTCFLWQPGILTLHIVSDTLIAIAYFSIPVMLIQFARRRKDIPFGFVFWMFATFIIACGLTHVMDIWTIWHPDYWLAGGMKALTAFASIATAVALVPLLRLALVLQTPNEVNRLKDQMELKHRRILDTTSEGRWILDASGRTTFVNGRLATMLGYAQNELLGRSVYDFLHAEGVGLAELSFKRCVGGGACDYEALFNRKDGTEMWGKVVMTALHDAEGNFSGAVGALVDNTEARVAKLDLASSERRYRVLGEAMPHIVWLAVPSGDVIYYNTAWYEYTGTTPEEMLDAGWGQQLYPEDLPTCVERWHTSLETGASFECQFRLFRAVDRTYRWHLGSATAERNDRGDIVEWIGSCIDIHDYILAGETREILDTIPQIVSMHGENELVDYINPRWNEYTGCAPGVGLGRAWREYIHPDDIAKLEALTASERSCQSMTSQTYELRIRRRDGAYRWFLTEKLPLPSSDARGMRWLQTSTDIDDVKRAQAALVRSEEQYRTLTEAMPQMVWTIGAAAQFLFVNHRWTEYTGLTLEECVAAGREGFIEEAGRLEIDAARRIRPAKEFACEARIRRYDGAYRCHLIHTVPLIDAHGVVTQWIVSGTDIEERKAAATAIALAHDAALASTEAKSRFLATMSHEVRTPMSGVIGMADLLLLTEQTAQQREYATVVRECGRTLLRVLNDILDYSKIEAGKFELEAIGFELSSHVRSAVDLLGPQYAAKGVAYVTQLASDLPAFVSGDPGRLRQILINLASNALKFTPAGGAVTIAVARGPEYDGRIPLRFTCTDTGIGIPPEDVDRLFQPFTQADGTTSRKYGGTGLGLSISAALVALMDGTIGVESTCEVGSTFWFTIPFCEVATATAIPETFASEAAHLDALPRREEKILLVEDNEVNTFLALDQFRRLGFDVTAVANGRESVAAVQSERFDLVFMDCHMPEMDGFEATKAIRDLEDATNARLPIVAMTADARIEDREVCLAAGMDDYLSKPASIGDLQAIVDRWLPRSTENA